MISDASFLLCFAWVFISLHGYWHINIEKRLRKLELQNVAENQKSDDQ